MTEEEKKAICELKNYISRRKLNYTKLDRHDKSIDNLLNLIEKLQKENEELRKKLNEENERCMMLAIEKQDYFEKYKYHLQQNESLTKEFSNVIPIQKVKDKIEEIQEEGYWLFTTDRDSDKCVEILQELIEERED